MAEQARTAAGHDRPACVASNFGQPGTQVLRGDGPLDSRHGRYIGGRFGGDWWFDRDSPFGINGSIALLERDSSNITYAPHTITPLARPYLDATDGQWHSFIVADSSPQLGELSGSINVYSRIEFFAEDVNGLLRLGQGENYRVNLLAGAHFLQLRERLDITGTSRILPDESTLIGGTDHFTTFNKFYGGQMGLSGWPAAAAGRSMAKESSSRPTCKKSAPKATASSTRSKAAPPRIRPACPAEQHRRSANQVHCHGMGPELGWSLNCRASNSRRPLLLTWNNLAGPAVKSSPSIIANRRRWPDAERPLPHRFFWAQARTGRTRAGERIDQNELGGHDAAFARHDIVQRACCLFS